MKATALSSADFLKYFYYAGIWCVALLSNYIQTPCICPPTLLSALCLLPSGLSAYLYALNFTESAGGDTQHFTTPPPLGGSR